MVNGQTLAFMERGELTRSGLNEELNKRMVEMPLWNVVSCGAEKEMMGKMDIRAPEAFGMEGWRRRTKLVQNKEHRT